jgi:hypothetical protein
LILIITKKSSIVSKLKKMKKKILCFDLDNIICRTKKNYYKRSIPIKKSIKFINLLYENNYYIKIFTARFMGRNSDNVLKAKKQGFQFTKKQLKKWKVSYHELILGKPSFDIFVDDKILGFKNNWISLLKKKLKFKT